MATHILHKVTFNDGIAAAVDLEPPDWIEMTYRFEPVPISSVFEAYSGAAKKQINSGATQKTTLEIVVDGFNPPPIGALSQSVTWTVTLIDKDSCSATEALTLWPVGPVAQTVNAKTARRAWSIRFREE